MRLPFCVKLVLCYYCLLSLWRNKYDDSDGDGDDGGGRSGGGDDDDDDDALEVSF